MLRRRIDETGENGWRVRREGPRHVGRHRAGKAAGVLVVASASLLYAGYQTGNRALVVGAAVALSFAPYVLVLPHVMRSRVFRKGAGGYSDANLLAVVMLLLRVPGSSRRTKVAEGQLHDGTEGPPDAEAMTCKGEATT